MQSNAADNLSHQHTKEDIHDVLTAPGISSPAFFIR